MAAAIGDDDGVGLGVTPLLNEVDGVGVVDGVEVAVGCAVSDVDVEPVAVLDGELLIEDAADADVDGLTSALDETEGDPSADQVPIGDAELSIVCVPSTVGFAD